MTLKSQIGQITSYLAQRADELPGSLKDAQKAVGRWRHRAGGLVRNNPGVAIVAALAAGFILARAARHA